MKKRNIGKFVNLLLFVWFAFIPIFWHIDLTKASFNFYDMFFMVPTAIPHLLVFYVLMFFSISFNKISLYHLILLVLYFPVIQLANYPFLTIRDAYLHAAPSKTILANGSITYPKDPAPESWPSSYVLHAAFSEVLGLDLIFTNYVLYMALIVVFAMILYSFADRLNKKGYKLSAISTILFLALFFTQYFDNFHHYSRTALAFTFLLIFIYVFANFNGRRGRILHILIAIAIITTHPFQSLALLVFGVFYCILTFKKEPINFVFFLSVMFVGWFMFVGASNFWEAISRIRTFLSPQYVSPLVKTLVPSEVLPWWGIILREIFKYSLVMLLILSSVSTMLVIYKRYKNLQLDRIQCGLSALLPMAGMMLLSLLLLPDWQIFRFIPFAAFPSAFTSFVLLDNLIGHHIGKLACRKPFLINKKLLTALFLIFVIALSTITMVMRFERNYYYGELDHPSELATLFFFFNNNHNTILSIVSWRTVVHSAYFNYNASHEVFRLWYKDLETIGKNSSQLLISQAKLINQSDAVIRGMRDEFDFSQVDSPKTTLTIIDQEIIQPRFSQIYSNGYYSVYIRQIKP